VSESYADKEVPETGAVTIAYDNGVRSGVSFTETCDMPKVTILTVAGDDGKVEIDFSNAGSYKLWFGKGFYKEGDIDPTTTEPGHLGYDEQFLELRNAIVEDRQPYSDVDVGIESLLVSYGAVLSGDAGRPVTREELMQLED
jgi:predicted dehydrogenase